MAIVKAVPNAPPDPKAGKLRPKSSIVFPYQTLGRSIEVAKLMHEKAGGSCTRSQIAALLGYSSVKNGAFLSRITSAKTFGLIEQEGEVLRTTTRARAIVSPVSDALAEQARVEAFMGVQLYERAYKEFDGRTLPTPVGLANLFHTQYGVVKDRAAPAVEVMLDSAEQAGLFKAAGNRTRMVVPLPSAAPAVSPTIPPPPIANANQEPPRRDGGGNGGRGGGGEGPAIHPAFIGLLSGLPEPGSRLTDKRRKALADAFTNIVNVVYPEDEQT